MTASPSLLFNSLVFLVFAVVFYAAWPLLRRSDASRWAGLTAASLLFYGWWDWRFVPLLIASGLLDFCVGAGMTRRPEHKKALLALSVIGNVGLLAFFKSPAWSVLPVGISFYTFQSMSYTLDIYRGRLKPTDSVLHFFAYLAMFPQLVAGPVVRARDLLPQLRSAAPPSPARRWEGLRLIVLGFFQKLVLADNLAPAVDAAFGAAQLSSEPTFWWLAASMFALQIYFDFSGYSLIARGLANWMGYDFPSNFRFPYAASSLRDFWHRWHISLSTWFRDYVYIPLGGSRAGRSAGLRNLWITMVLSGVWHGATWTFVTWGAVHATLVTIERLTRWPERLQRWTGGTRAGWLLTLAQVVAALVVFRSDSLAQAGQILSHMADVTQIAPEQALQLGPRALTVLVLAALGEAWAAGGRRIPQKWEPVALALGTA
ncbi:MAG: alginate O-acetyltransferase complex protein AlgI, partial [Myxococcota bacterium]